ETTYPGVHDEHHVPLVERRRVAAELPALFMAHGDSVHLYAPNVGYEPRRSRRLHTAVRRRYAQPSGLRPDAILNATGTLMPTSTAWISTNRSNAALMRSCTALGCRRMPIDVRTVPPRMPFQSSSGLARR